MGRNIPPIWYRAKVFLLRAVSLYLILVFLFMSNYLDTYNFKPYLNQPFDHITIYLSSIASSIFFKKQYTPRLGFRDYCWTDIALLVYLFIAVMIAFVWTLADKAKKIPGLFSYTCVFARYYLSAILLGYGISKLFGDQFGQPDMTTLIRPLGDFDLRSLFWEFMGASKSYQFFGGLIETTAGTLLLFRRTTTIGGIIALSLFMNILMLDFAYDVIVKVRVIFFILLTIYILTPDLKRLYGLFFLNQSAVLANMPPVIGNGKYKWVHYLIKVFLVVLVVSMILKKNMRMFAQYHYAANNNIAGIYKIDDIYLNNQLIKPSNGDTIRWNKIAINKYFPILGIQFTNDSIIEYFFKVDTLRKFIDLSLMNDPGIKSRLYYKNIKANEWHFEGTFNNNFIHVTSKKINTDNFILQKKYGILNWNNDH